MLVVIPQGEQASPLEREVRIEETGGPAYDAPTLFQTARDFEDHIASAGIRTLKLVRSMQQLEESPERFPLYSAWDYHLTTRGSTWAGVQIYDELERWQPWH